jgi:anti-sigma-K factor RskA
MPSKQLIDLIGRDDVWMEAVEPAGLQRKIMNSIESNVYKRMNLLRFFKVAAASCLTACVIMAGVVFYNTAVPTRLVIVYPHNENVQNVEVVGNFDKKDQRIQMTLDKDSELWTAEVYSHQKNIDDYTINVYETDTGDDAVSDDPTI